MLKNPKIRLNRLVRAGHQTVHKTKDQLLSNGNTEQTKIHKQQNPENHKGLSYGQKNLGRLLQHF